MNRREITYLLIAAMGFDWAALRYLLEVAFGESPFPFATLCINLFGCFAIEIVNDFIGRRLHLKPGIVRAMGTGMVGAFTTLSAFTNETLALMAQGQIAIALAYISLTAAGCFAAAYAGHLATGGMAARRLARLTRARNAARLERNGRKDGRP